MFKVEYKSGESRNMPGSGVDYMLCAGTWNDEPFELYAEIMTDPDFWDDVEFDTEPELRKAITEQASALYGIPEKFLNFSEI